MTEEEGRGRRSRKTKEEGASSLPRLSQHYDCVVQTDNLLNIRDTTIPTDTVVSVPKSTYHK